MPSQNIIEEFISKEVIIRKVLARYFVTTNETELRCNGSLDRLVRFVWEAFKIHYKDSNKEKINDLDVITKDLRTQITNETTNEFSLMQNYDEINHIAKEIPTDNEYNTQYDNSEKERDITDNEYDTDSESQNNSSEKERHIIDDALDPSRLLNNTGDFSPYFDITTALLFCWIQKHNISTHAYDDLVTANTVSILSKKMPLTSSESKMTYYLSINDIIWHVLNNPAIMNHMYFSPGIEANVKSEFWHGTLWAESPLFVWMLDDNFVFICPSQVYNKVTVKLPHLHQVLSHSDLYVLEIIYKHNNHWQIRDIQLSYQHPAHSIIINNPPVDSMPVYKLFLDLYYDDFGKFRNVYHSLGGAYVQFWQYASTYAKTT
ncbi:hypothetical protein C1646_773862 [Rhizophagus diaphanus]|nr:hypothetical protein C1646_773862 [Rhizophagus diaphanus] [Rhizophagus sp. MUCL 43196]